MTLRMFEITCPSPVKQRAGIGSGISSVLDSDTSAAAAATCNAPTGTLFSAEKTEFGCAFCSAVDADLGTFGSFGTALLARFMAMMLLTV
jgi:hypothetical protein